MIIHKLNARVVTVMAEETITFGNTPTRKRTLVFEEAEAEYPAQVAVDWWGDRADLVQNIRAGDVVVVEFKIESKPSKFKGKPYTNLSGRAIALAKKEEESAPSAEEAAPQTTSSEGDYPPF